MGRGYAVDLGNRRHQAVPEVNNEGAILGRKVAYSVKGGMTKAEVAREEATALIAERTFMIAGDSGRQR